ncbi:MAG: Hsp70 family protein [Pseudomonadota bacterium]|nr:Hsp70 family protein [Pseudomonadota bacterium]
MLTISEPGQDKKRQVIGIDLGTTFSLVAYDKEGQVHFVPLDGDATALPSMVAYGENGEMSFGQHAVDLLKAGGQNVFYSMKRLMGKNVEDAQTFAQTVPFEIAGDAQIAKARFKNIEKSAVEVSADLLKHMKHKTEQHLGQAVYDAVITVPAYFNDAQRQATKDAAKLAGLNVMRLISEPTAAALAYGLDKKAEGQFLVYDLGGGTFDVSLLKLTGGVFRVVATGGDTYLGGDDIDHALAQAKGITPLEARALKEQNGAGVADCAKPIIAKTLQICDDVLNDAEMTEDDLDGIVLVGGSTRLPLVATMVEDTFGHKPQTGINPDQVVAHGAALQASALAGHKRDDMLLLDVTPLSLGLETMGGLVEKVIERNTPIPITRAQKFTTFKDGQTAMDIHVLQGERETVEGCRSLAKFRLKGIPSLPAGAARIVVRFALDADGMLTVTADEETSGVSQSVDVVPSYGLKPDDMLTMLKDSMAHAQQDVGFRQLKEAQLELERVIDACALALEKDGALLDETTFKNLENALKVAKSFLTASNRDDVEDAMETLENAFQSFSEQRVNNALKQAVVGQNIYSEEKGETNK